MLAGWFSNATQLDSTQQRQRMIVLDRPATRPCFAAAATLVALCLAGMPRMALAEDFLKVTDVESQPLAAAVERLVEALEYVGAPLPVADRDSLKASLKETNNV